MLTYEQRGHIQPKLRNKGARSFSRSLSLSLARARALSLSLSLSLPLSPSPHTNTHTHSVVTFNQRREAEGALTYGTLLNGKNLNMKWYVPNAPASQSFKAGLSPRGTRAAAAVASGAPPASAGVYIICIIYIYIIYYMDLSPGGPRAAGLH
jgi:hypothetical protein